MAKEIEIRQGHMYPKGTFDQITIDDLRSYQADGLAEEKEAAIRAAKNECICGTVNCSTEYACHTSGW